MGAMDTQLHGLLVLDKPGGLTSRAAINRLQKQLPRGTKIGHTGTLDPLATGVLVVCLGQATRLAEYVQAMPKTYRSTFCLGSRSDTDDAGGNITVTPGAQPVALAEIESALRPFVGEIEQIPPAYSAAKIERPAIVRPGPRGRGGRSASRAASPFMASICFRTPGRFSMSKFAAARGPTFVRSLATWASGSVAGPTSRSFGEPASGRLAWRMRFRSNPISKPFAGRFGR